MKRNAYGSTRRAYELDGIALSEIEYPPNFRQAKHDHPWTSVTLVLGGGLEERVGSTVETAAPLSVVVKPAGTEHADRVGSVGARTFQLALRPDLLEGDRSPHRTLGDWRWFHAGAPARHFLSLLKLFRAETRDESSVEAAVFDLLGSLESQDGTNGTGRPPRWLATVVDEIDDDFAMGLRVRALAMKAGVHPISLARAFRRHYGVSVTDRIRSRRVQAAAALLSRSSPPLSDVAYSAGFADQSHMCRDFKAGTGLTPGRFRALAGR